MYAEIRHRLGELTEEPYRVFASRLLPGEERLLGVRLPLLRKLARQIARGNWRDYLRAARDDSFEEILLQGMVIGCARCSVGERLAYIRGFVPKIHNWSVCDSFCAGLKFAVEAPEPIWDFIGPYFTSPREFDVRFAVVTLLMYYLNEAYLEEALSRLCKVHHDGYYAEMAVAWAMAEAYSRFPEQTEPLLRRGVLDEKTRRFARQKIRESHKVNEDDKRRLFAE